MAEPRPIRAPVLERRSTELRRALHRVVDAALAADDVITTDDADACRHALDALARNVDPAIATTGTRR